MVAMSRTVEVGLLVQPQHWRARHLRHHSYHYCQQQSQRYHLSQRPLLLLPWQSLSWNQSHIQTFLHVFPQHLTYISLRYELLHIF